MDETATTMPVVESASAPSLTNTTVRLGGSILAGMVAGLVLQIWVVAFLGWQGPRALFVRSIYVPVGFIILAVTQGLVVATQVCAGTADRNGQRAEALRHGITFLAAGVGILGLTAVVFVTAGDVIMTALAVPRDERPVVTGFIAVVSVASALGLVPALAGAALLGVGRAWAAAAFGASFTGLAMGAMVLLNTATDLGVLAVPLGEVVATVVVGSAIVAVLSRYGIRLPRWRLSTDGLRQLWVLAAPVAATFLLLSVVTFGYLWVLRHAGKTEITGFTLGQMATQFAMVPALAIGSGAAIATNLYPHDDRSVPGRAGLSALLRVTVPLYLVVGAVAFVARKPLSRLFTPDEGVAAVAADYLAWLAPTFVLFAGALAMLTFLEQIGKARAAFVLNTIYFAVIMAFAFELPQPVGSDALGRLLAFGNLVGFWTLVASVVLLVRRLDRR